MVDVYGKLGTYIMEPMSEGDVIQLEKLLRYVILGGWDPSWVMRVTPPFMSQTKGHVHGR